MKDFKDNRRHTNPDIPLSENIIDSAIRNIRAHNASNNKNQMKLFEESAPIRGEFIICPYCGTIDPYQKHNIEHLKEYQCKKCNKTFYKRLDGNKLTSEDFNFIKNH